MNFLVIDTTSKKAIVVGNINDKYINIAVGQEKQHSENLLSEIEHILLENKITLADLDAIGCITGPGSFTGIRIAITTIKAFSFVYKTNIVSSSIFDVLAPVVKDGVVIMPSTKSTFYYGNIKASKLESASFENYENFYKVVGNKKLFLKGLEQNTLNNSYTNYDTIDNYSDLLYKHFYDKINAKDFTQPEDLQPYYLQLSQAEKDLKKSEEK